MDVGNPFALAAGVVQVEHGGHGVHADGIDMIVLKPKQGAGNEKGPDFEAAGIKDVAVPVGMVAFAGIGVLEKVGAVEKGQAVAVGRKMGGHPVEHHADAVLVQPVNERHEILGRAEAAGGGEIAQCLIAPGAEEGMFHDGQEFDMGKAGPQHVFGEMIGHFHIG